MEDVQSTRIARDENGRWIGSGNPKGRQRKVITIAACIAKYMRKPERRNRLAAVLYDEAVTNRNIAAAKLLIESADFFDIEMRLRALEEMKT